MQRHGSGIRKRLFNSVTRRLWGRWSIEPSPGAGGGGGGGAILIATSTQIQLFGSISAVGGNGALYNPSTYLVYSGNGSGGAVRLVASELTGNGVINVSGGSHFSAKVLHASGFIRFDTYDNEFRGATLGVFTQGSQFIIVPTSGQLPQLTVTSVGGVPVSASPTGALSTPDAVLSAQQNNPIPIVVSCANLPLNTQITVSVKPANGAAVSATGLRACLKIPFHRGIRPAGGAGCVSWR